MGRSVVVTGASGFLGSHICEALHEAGFEVHALIRPSSSTRWLKHDWIHIHRARLFDRETITAILKDKYAVVHAAAALIGSRQDELEKVNVDATRILAECAVAAGVKRLVFISSNSVVGPTRDLKFVDETDMDHPLSPYGKSKKQAELILSEFQDQLSIINLRCVVIYGPRDKHLVRLFRFVDSPLTLLLGTKPLYLACVYVKDAARAAVAAVKADVPSCSTYYISDDIIYTFDVIYDLIASSVQRKLRFIRVPIWMAQIGMSLVFGAKRKEIAFTPQSIREFRYRFRLVSNDKAKRELGWTPVTHPARAFAETVDWYRSKGWL